jgi:hypothetical protein
VDTDEDGGDGEGVLHDLVQELGGKGEEGEVCCWRGTRLCFIGQCCIQERGEGTYAAISKSLTGPISIRHSIGAGRLPKYK